MIEMMVIVINDSVIEAINMTSGLLVTKHQTHQSPTVWKCTVEKSWTNQTHQAKLTLEVWKRTVEKSQTKQTQPANLRGGALK